MVAVAEWLAKHSRGVNFAGGEIGTSRSGSLYRSVGVITYVGAPYDWHFMWVKFVKIHYEHPVRGLRPIVPESICNMQYAICNIKINQICSQPNLMKICRKLEYHVEKINFDIDKNRLVRAHTSIKRKL